MKAFVHENDTLKMKEMNEPTAAKGEVVVAMKTVGLNRRDLSIPAQRKGLNEALVVGSDGAGVIESVGESVTQFQPGDEVIINPSLRWNKKSNAPPAAFDILGHPEDGTFAEKIAISAEQVEEKPAHLTWEEAGVLALSALTGYRALVTRGEVQQGDTVFIPGAGSGVATYLIAFAKAQGAKVIVTSRSQTKQKQAKERGADIALDTNSSWPDALKDETIDLVIDSVGRATVNRSLDILKRGGKLVVFGATTEDIAEINLRHFFYGQYEMIGSTMGSREELRDMLAFIKRYDIRPVVDETFDFDAMHDALAYMQGKKQFGKIALRVSP